MRRRELIYVVVEVKPNYPTLLRSNMPIRGLEVAKADPNGTPSRVFPSERQSFSGDFSTRSWADSVLYRHKNMATRESLTETGEGHHFASVLAYHKPS
jgi:hypothetical protein